MSRLLASQSDSDRDQLRMSTLGDPEIISLLEVRFEREKHRIEKLSLRALEKAAKTGNKTSEKKWATESIEFVSKIQEAMQRRTSKLDTIFRSALSAVRLEERKRSETETRLAELKKENKYWQKVNERIESQLNKVDGEKIDLEVKLKEEGEAQDRLRRQIRVGDIELASKEQQIREKHLEIQDMRKVVDESDRRVRQAEVEKGAVEFKQEQATQDLEEARQDKLLNQRSAEKEILNLVSTNQDLERYLETEQTQKLDLEQEIKRMKRKLIAKDFIIQTMRARNGLRDDRLWSEGSVKNKQGSFLQIVEASSKGGKLDSMNDIKGNSSKFQVNKADRKNSTYLSDLGEIKDLDDLQVDENSPSKKSRGVSVNPTSIHDLPLLEDFTPDLQSKKRKESKRGSLFGVIGKIGEQPGEEEESNLPIKESRNTTPLEKIEDSNPFKLTNEAETQSQMSGQMVQNIITNNYNINNVTNTGVKTLRQTVNSQGAIVIDEDQMNLVAEDLESKTEVIEPDSVSFTLPENNVSNKVSGEVRTDLEVPQFTWIDAPEEIKSESPPVQSEKKSMFGVSQFHQLELSHVKQLPLKTSEVITSPVKQEPLLNQESFLKKNLSEVKEKGESSRTGSFEMTKGYIDETFKAINKKMTETDYKGNKIAHTPSEGSINTEVKSISLQKSDESNAFLEFGRPEKLLNLKNKSRPRQGRRTGKSKIKSLRKKSDLTRPTKLSIPKLHPMRSTCFPNNKMNQFKKHLIMLTNQKNTASSDDEQIDSDFLSDDEDLTIQQNPSSLNRMIGLQLNPNKVLFRNRKVSLGAMSQSMSSKFGVRNKLPLTARRRTNSIKRAILFKGLAYVCDKSTKFLKILHISLTTLMLISKKSLKVYLNLPLDRIVKFVTSEKDSFLLQLFYKSAENNPEGDLQTLHLEFPQCSRALRVIRARGLEYRIMQRKSLKIEGDDLFKNCSLNIFPRALKQGFLDLFVNDFFDDWKTFFVCQVDKCLFLFPAQRKTHYTDYKAILRKVKIYRVISYNLVKTSTVIGLNRQYTFVVKIHNESTQLIFSAYSKKERRNWLQCM